MDIPKLVDLFVEKTNAGHREQMPLKDVPDYLRDGERDEYFTGWKIIRRDNSEAIEKLAAQLPLRFPPSFHYFVSNYSFPAFQTESIVFYGNTGQNTFYELSKRLFYDPVMSPFLLKAGYLQIGNPRFDENYDPVCFDTNEKQEEHSMIQLDHEAILIDREIEVIEEIAPSFVEYLRKVIENSGA